MGEEIFFGYGSYRNRERLKKILGKDPGEGEDAVLEGYELAIQTLHQIPPEVRKILGKAWGEDFRAYTIKKGNGMVIGKIWKLNNADLEKIKNWEFMNGNEPWREIKTVTVKSRSGTVITAITEKALDSQYTKETVNGLEYSDNLNMTLENLKYWQQYDEYRIDEITRIRNEIRGLSRSCTA